MSESNEFDAELNGVVIEYTELLGSMQKLIYDYNQAKSDEARQFINYELEDYKRQITILKQRIAILKSKKNK